MCSKDIPRCNCRDLYHFDSCCMYRAGAWIFTLFFIFFPCWWEPRKGSDNQSHHGLICPAGVSQMHFSAHAKKPIRPTLWGARCGQRLPDTPQDLPSRGILMPHHPPWATFITKQGWMPSEMIQVRANVAHVLSPGKLRNFPRMKLWEPGKPGGCNAPPRADNKASVSKQQDQGQRGRRRKAPWEPAGHWLQTGGWILKRETQREQAARHRHEWNIFYRLVWGI